MIRDRIKNILLSGKPGQKVTLCGWVRSKRESKNFAFVVLYDGSSQQTLQVIVDQGSKAFLALPECNTGAALKIEGSLRESPGQGQKFEVQAETIEVLGGADPETFPLQKKGHTLEFLRDIGHLRGRTNTFGAVFRVRNCLAMAVHEFFQRRGFIWAHTPIITASDCEGAGELFQVTTLPLNKLPKTADGKIDFDQDFFGRPTYLTVSGQLQGELMAMSMGDIYTFGPTFRAENSNTTRHLSEFWMIEPEMAFADLQDDMDLARDFLRFLCKSAVENCREELDFFEKQYKTMTVKDIEGLVEAKFHQISYTDAVKELEKSGKKFEFPIKWGLDMQSEHERFLTDEVFKGPVIVNNYPKDIKAFYMRMNDDGKTVAAMDVLAPRIGEIIGGSQREERLDRLMQRMEEMKIPAHELGWYLDTRRYGSAPHAGFGLGFERVVQYITGMGNIRDVIPFPRAPRTVSF